MYSSAAVAQAVSPDQKEQAVPSTASDEVPTRLTDIIVTANRREETILDVPISIAAFSQEQLDQKGIRNISDIARVTPGLTITEGFSGIKYIAIRGLSSSVGATMTGLYIDDTPIQVRNLVLITNFYPALYDLERVEVLRGPQGTLFGAGAMGGAVRFILAKPSLTEYSGNTRAELAFTEGGDPTYEAGGAVGGPIVEDKIGFRVSAYYRRDGGYVDRVPFHPERGTPEKNSNSNRAFVATAALTLKPTEDISITPSIFYQNAHSDDASTWWTFGNGSTRPQPPLFQSGEGFASAKEDRNRLYTLKAEWDAGPVSLISNSSIIDRTIRSSDDGTAFLLDVFDGAFANAFDPLFQLFYGQNLDFALDLDGMENFRIDLDMTQKSFAQEFRVQSNDPEARLKYVFGVFYQNARQSSHEIDIAPNSPGFYLLPPLGVPGLDPVLPTGPTGIQADSFNRIRDRQYAAFGQVDWEVLQGLTLTAGLRYSRVEFESFTLNTDPVTGVMADPITGGAVDTPLTPKAGVQYEVRPGLMVYATAAKGFRAGGINTATDPGGTCGPSLEDLNLTEIPKTYKADSVWSYELGVKGRVGNLASFAADVFTIQWDDIQRSRTLPSCVAIFTDNFGKARSRGFEAQVTLTPARGLSFDLAVGYVDATQRETIQPFINLEGDPRQFNTSVRKGDRFAIPWTVSGAVDYETPLGSGDTRVYGHAQYDYKSGYSVRPGNIGFNPVTGTTDDQHYVSARLGIRKNGFDISAFVNNLTNSRDIIGRLHFQPSERIQIQTQRPRTWGVTTRYNF